MELHEIGGEGLEEEEEMCVIQDLPLVWPLGEVVMSLSESLSSPTSPVSIDCCTSSYMTRSCSRQHAESCMCGGVCVREGEREP